MGEAVNYDPRRQPFDLPNVLAALAILGYGNPQSVAIHSRRLQVSKTLNAHQYIVAPTYFQIDEDAELILSTESELRIF